uniref:Uncharacterized protein n=1 Tax=Magallana gigas TaxID=29159 RepID=A0A8W8N2V8_MAGGI
MADINKSDLFVRLYLILELSGFLLHLVGFCTPYWRSLHFKYTEDVIQDIDIVIQGFDEGIWRRCVNGICSEINVVGRAASILLSTIVYGASVREGITWSYGCVVIGGIFYTASGTLMLFTYFLTRPK